MTARDSPIPESWFSWRLLRLALSLLLFAAALFAIYRAAEGVRLPDVALAFRATPPATIAFAILLAAASYGVLIVYDLIALRYIHQRLPLKQVGLAAFVGAALSHNLGLTLVTAGSVRYRIYSSVGLAAPDIALMTVVCSLTFLFGIAGVLGMALLVNPAVLPGLGHLPEPLSAAFGVLLLLTIVAFIGWTVVRRRPISLRDWRFSLPHPGLALLQVGAGVLDLVLAGATLYVLLPPEVAGTLGDFLGIYAAATGLGAASNLPGALGVFDAVVLAGLPDNAQAGLLGALVLYRVVYYLLPLLLAAILLVGMELRARPTLLRPVVRSAAALSNAMTPTILGTAVLVGGAILMFSAATPALHDRMTTLRMIVPLPFVEASHLLSSVVGFGLVILSRGLFRRLQAAHSLTVMVLAGGVTFALLKGGDYEESLVLMIVLGLLLVARRRFHRSGAVLGQPFTLAWLAMIAVVLVSAMWLGFFAYRHVEYSDELWWQFAYRADAPRFLRASVVVAALALGLLIYLLLRPARASRVTPPVDMVAVEAVVASATRTDAHLAFTGDKQFLFAPNRNAFLMYRVQGRSAVVFGDPVGNPASWTDLLWRFREYCDRNDRRPVFYQVLPEHLPRYLDIGLSALKLGEEARVPLGDFSLEGPARRDLRYAVRRAAKEDGVFEIVPAAAIPPLLPELRRVSDAWLQARGAREKGFSLGHFADNYICRFDCAVVRREGKVVAFANLWQSTAGLELSVDLMRHADDAPYGVMDVLFAETMLWGKARGFRWFNLGMAPLAGLEAHPLGPLWHRIGARIFRYGENFYNFEGLRAYKEKFQPEWSPRYLAAPGGLVLPRALIDAATLIAGGTVGIFRA